METKYFTKPFITFEKFLFGMLLLLNATAFSQVTPTETPPTEQEPTGYSIGKLDINDPNSIVNAYTYDAASNRYIYTRTVDGFNINYPIILTPEEYEQLVLKESMRKYYKEKSDAIDGKKEGSEEKKKDLLPTAGMNHKDKVGSRRMDWWKRSYTQGLHSNRERIRG